MDDEGADRSFGGRPYDQLRRDAGAERLVGQAKEALLLGPRQSAGGLLGREPGERVVLVVEHRVAGKGLRRRPESD
jgi:hypothetical protein